MKTGDQDLSFVLNKALLRTDDSLTSLETGLACIKLINLPLPYTTIKETEKVKYKVLLTEKRSLGTFGVRQNHQSKHCNLSEAEIILFG